MSELLRLAYGVILDTECYVCDTPFEMQRLKLEPADDDDTDFTSPYDCHGCDAEYTVRIIENGANIVAKISHDNRELTDDVRDAEMTRSARKSSVYEEIHPHRDLVDAVNSLLEATMLITENKERIVEAHQKLQQIDNLAEEKLDAKPNVEIHNYLASSYSFSQILETIKPDLPTDGPVDDAMKNFNEENKVISGLRIYSQHHLLPELHFTSYSNDSLDDMRFSFTFDKQEVIVNESGVGKYGEDGYKHNAEYHYGSVEGDIIDIVLRVESHYNALEHLTNTIIQHVEKTKADEIRDYRDQTSLDI